MNERTNASDRCAPSSYQRLRLCSSPPPPISVRSRRRAQGTTTHNLVTGTVLLRPPRSVKPSRLQEACMLSSKNTSSSDCSQNKAGAHTILRRVHPRPRALGSRRRNRCAAECRKNAPTLILRIHPECNQCHLEPSWLDT